MDHSAEDVSYLLSLTYSDQEWERDSYAMAAERAAPMPCPLCDRTGFYGPRARDGGLKFRSCRFCGFTQEVGGKPILLLPAVHGCDPWPDCAKAPYIWWIDPESEVYTCTYCGEPVAVAAGSWAENGIVVPPSNDPEHPWWRVPQHKSYSYYQHFWANWPSTKGRVIL